MKVLYSLLVLCLLLSTPALAQRTWNANTPGQRFEVSDNLRREGQSVVIFVSGQSDACEGFLEQLQPLQGELEINYLQIDRPEAKNIDWKSPLSRQYNLRELPYVLIFEGKDKIKEGHEARKMLLTLLDSSAD